MKHNAHTLNLNFLLLSSSISLSHIHVKQVVLNVTSISMVPAVFLAPPLAVAMANVRLASIKMANVFLAPITTSEASIVTFPALKIVKILQRIFPSAHIRHQEQVNA